LKRRRAQVPPLPALDAAGARHSITQAPVVHCPRARRDARRVETLFVVRFRRPSFRSFGRSDVPSFVVPSFVPSFRWSFRRSVVPF
jgi:hypothetical protein